MPPYPADLLYLNSHPLEVVSRYRDSQLQVAENYSYLFNLGPILTFKQSFYSQLHRFNQLIKQIKNNNCRDQQDKG